MKITVTVALLGLILFGAGCTEPAASQPHQVKAAASLPQIGNLPSRTGKTTCAYPAGWYPYQVQINETIYSIAGRAGVGAANLLSGNCLANAGEAREGVWLRVPPQTLLATPQTLLPLGISALVADPTVIPAGGTVTVAWQAQGPIINVRLGWLSNNQFVEAVSNLPAVGTWALAVPADGRDSITLMVRVSDGLQEIAAQTTIRILCPEAWFFSPAPAGCPTPPLMTTFREQRFERGTIVYIPAMRLSYALINGHAPVKIEDRFAPGMPLSDPTLTVPAGLMQPTGPIHYAWRGADGLPAALGYATEPEVTYFGIFQETVTMSGETAYLLSSAGQVYVLPPGTPWGIIRVQ